MIIPFYNDQANVQPLCQSLREVFRGDPRVEFILVDDGSTDGTLAELTAVHREDRRFKVVTLRRNAGQRLAVTAGIRLSSGAFIVTMDPDLENDPADIDRLIDQLRRGADIVGGWRMKRCDPLMRRRVPSMLANKILWLLTGTRLHDFGCALAAYRRSLTARVLDLSPSGVFAKSFACLLAENVVEIRVSYSLRVRGTSSYNFRTPDMG